MSAKMSRTRRAGQFVPGHSGNPDGRPKGVPNAATREVRELTRALIGDVDYRVRFRQRLIAGKLPPAVECMLWHYAYGKPKDTVKLEESASLAEIIALAVRGEAGSRG